MERIACCKGKRLGRPALMRPAVIVSLMILVACALLSTSPKRPTDVCVRYGLEVNVGKAGLHVARVGAVILCSKSEWDMRQERNLTGKAAKYQCIQTGTISGYWRGAMAQFPFKIPRPFERTDLGRVLYR